MANKEDVASSGRWTAIGTYLRPLHRRSGSRRRLSARPRREPEGPHALLSTIPYVALAIGLALVTIIIASLARPGQYRERTRPPVESAAASEPGTAPPGWIDDAPRQN